MVFHHAGQLTTLNMEITHRPRDRLLGDYFKSVSDLIPREISEKQLKV